MASEISRYKMARPTSSKKSYKYLYGTLVRYVNSDKKDKNRAALLAAKNGSTSRAMAGLVAELDGEIEDGTPVPTAPAAIKTKQGCYKFLKGTCTRGDKCTYSHDPKVELSKAEKDRLEKAQAKKEKETKDK
eukprot:16134464-Heterocapsa_arctica.AAC.1